MPISDEGLGIGPLLTIGSSKRASQDDIPKNYYVKPPGQIIIQRSFDE
jgi:hypothetical protein